MSGGASTGSSQGGVSGTGTAPPGVAAGSGSVTTAAPGAVPNGGATLLGRLRSGLPLPVHDHLLPSTGGVIDYLRTLWGSDHLAAPDPHPQYATDLELAAQLADYLTGEEADARYQQGSEKSQPNGYAALDASGVIPTSQLPPLAVTDVFTAAAEAAMLALPAQQGDLCLRSDTGLTYVLAAAPPSTRANWVEVMAAGQVVSVNGQTGTVHLTAADVGAYTTGEADAAFLTAAEGDALFLTPAEGNAAYAALGHTHPSEVTGDWYFSGSTNVSVDPGNGNFRANTGVLTTATTLAASRTDNDGYQVTVFDALQQDDVIYLQDKNNNTRWVRYRVSGAPTRFATYSLLPVALLASSGVAIGTAQLCTAIFTVGAGGGGAGAGGGMATDALWAQKGDLAAGTGANAGARVAVGTDGQVLTADSSQPLGVTWAATALGAVWASFVIDGGGAAITTGQKGHFVVPAGTIVEARLLADVSGSVVIDLWKATYATYPPAAGASICAAAKPTLSSAQKSQNATLIGWTTAVADGDVLAVQVDSAATVGRVTLGLRIQRS